MPLAYESQGSSKSRLQLTMQNKPCRAFARLGLTLLHLSETDPTPGSSPDDLSHILAGPICS